MIESDPGGEFSRNGYGDNLADYNVDPSLKLEGHGPPI